MEILQCLHLFHQQFLFGKSKNVWYKHKIIKIFISTILYYVSVHLFIDIRIDTYFRPSTLFVVDQMPILMGTQIRRTKNNKALSYLKSHSKISIGKKPEHKPFRQPRRTYPCNDRAEFLAEFASGFDVVLWGLPEIFNILALCKLMCNSKDKN